MKFRLFGRLICIFVTLFVLSGLASPLLAQIALGTLRCQVTDPSGGAMTEATVLLTSAAGETKALQGSKDGIYEFKGLAPGKYTVKAIAKGFAIYEQQGVEISPGQVQKLGIALKIEEEVQKITVSGEAATVSVNPENNASSLVISGKELESLSDDPDELQSELQELAGPSAGPNGGQVYIDGFTGGQLPPKSSILEIRVNQNPFSAEYDRLGYGRVEITTKPGIAQFHGQGFVSGNTTAFNTRNPFAAQEPTYHSEFYNGNIGGPINKKASFFFSVFRRDLNDANVVSAYVLSPDLTQQVPYSQAVLNPHTRMNLGPRVDYQLSSKNVMTVRYQYWGNNDTDNGIGLFSLPSQAYNDNGSEQTLQVGDTQVISDRTVNQARFQYLHDSSYQAPVNLSLSGTSNLIGSPIGCLLLAQPCQVSAFGAFTGGGNNAGTSTDIENHYEFQNYTSITLGKNFVRFGGRLRDVDETISSTSSFNGSFAFPSLTAYQITRQGLEAGWTDAQIRAAGGGANQFSINRGIPAASINYADLGLYGEDDWRALPNMTLSLGLRFETQTGIRDHADVAPRVGLAWGLGRGKSPKTVLRAGMGIFYDRISQGSLLAAERLNGCVQQSYTVDYPDFFPNLPTDIPAVGAAPGCQPGSNVDPLDPNLRTPYTVQGGAGIERQLSKNATVSVTYLTSHGVHQIMTRDINAPLPGTYPFGDPSVGVRPYESYGNVTDVGHIYQYESAGIFNQNQLITNFNLRMGAKLMLFGFYTLGYANSNTGSPMNPYDIAEDYGRSGYDVRNRVFLGGTWTVPHGFAFSPFVVANSGAPFNITLNQLDLYGTANYNDRPALASPGASGSNIVVTRWGTFNTVPSPNSTIIGPNYGTGPGQFTANLRVSKTFGLGKKTESSSRGQGGGPGGRGGYGGGLGGRGLGGGGGGGMFGPASTNTRYTLTFSANARNIFNNVNLATPYGVLNTNSFGVSNGLVGGFFSSAAANRRVDFQVAFNF
ncbi:MAG: carboxypeptidase regulatory-like domain-containing protein [Terriglobia bacterium]